MSAERTKEKGSQRPWALLIEKASASGDRVELETTAFSTDNGIKDFLGREVQKVAGDIQTLERKLLSLSRKKSSGRLRGLPEVGQIEGGIEEDINRKRANLGVLQGRGRQPIKIRMVDRQIVSWVHPSGGEDIWLHYVGDERPEILSFSTEERSLLQRIFMSKYALMQGKRGALVEYEELLYELRKSDPKEELAPYIKEISQRLSQR